MCYHAIENDEEDEVVDEDEGHEMMPYSGSDTPTTTLQRAKRSFVRRQNSMLKEYEEVSRRSFICFSLVFINGPACFRRLAVLPDAFTSLFFLYFILRDTILYATDDILVYIFGHGGA